MNLVHSRTLHFPLNARLKFVSGNEPLVLPPTDGTETIARATGVFRYIDSNFTRWDCDTPEPPAEETTLHVYEIAQDGTFRELFGSFGTEPERLSLTQSQIIQFVKRYPHWLKQNGNGTFFLFKTSQEFLVAAVYLFSDGRLGVRAPRFTLSRTFRSVKRHRLVVPQPAATAS
jgi:hypothetical protein